MGFHHVGQVGLKLLISSDPPAFALACQSTGITGVNHCACRSLCFLPILVHGHLRASLIVESNKAQDLNVGVSLLYSKAHRMDSCSVAQDGVQWHNLDSLQLCLLGSSNSSASASQMGFHHVGQAGLELLTSSDPPSSASQSAGLQGANPGTSVLPQSVHGCHLHPHS
ncbi:hypothetical protein AAY473_001231 [Plecturocebus cupreus]